MRQGASLARIGTTNGLPMILEEGEDAGVSGWGWSDSSWGATATPVYFAQSGLQTIRIQQREDGVGWDQLILSSAAKTTRPGLLKNDTTIVDESLRNVYWRQRGAPIYAGGDLPDAPRRHRRRRRVGDRNDLGDGQIDRRPGFLRHRRTTAARTVTRLTDLFVSTGISVPPQPESGQ